MNAVELALAKQRLQMKAALQREDLARYATGLQPVFAAADQVRTGMRWVGRHPEVAAAGVAVVAATSPGARSFLWRWSKRAFVVWQFWLKAGLPQPPAR
jgi:hypothetical protein